MSKDNTPLDLDLYRHLKEAAELTRAWAELEAVLIVHGAKRLWELEHKIIRFPVERVTEPPAGSSS